MNKQPSSNYRLISIDYDENNNDSIDNKFVYEYDDNGNNEKVKKTDFNDSSRNTTTSKTFDKNSNVLTITEKYTNLDPEKILLTTLAVWTFTYDQSGKKISEKHEDFKRDHFDYWIEDKNIRTSYSASGDVISLNQFTIDSHGNKLKELIDTNNNGVTDREVNNTYNHDGKRLTRIIIDLNDTNKANLFEETRTYDPYGNIKSIITSKPFEAITPYTVKYEYIYDMYENILTSSTVFESGKIDKRIYVWEEIMPPVSFIKPINWAGTGCKAGHVSVSGENTASLSILFDSYDAGKDSRSGLKRTACSFSMAIKVLPGYRISQLTTDWEGYAEGEGELGRKYFLAGQPTPSWLNTRYNNPDGDNFSQRDSLYHDSFVTGCRGDEYNLRIDSQIKTITDDSYIAIDSADLHSNVRFLLRSEPCR